MFAKIKTNLYDKNASYHMTLGVKERHAIKSVKH